jgi:hypothetical protein
MTTKCVKATGTTGLGMSVERIYITEDQKAAERAFIETPMEKGGVSSWSMEELEDVPASHKLECPHCSETFPNPNTVIKL